MYHLRYNICNSTTNAVCRCYDIATAFVKLNLKRIIENAMSTNEIHNFACIVFLHAETAHVDIRHAE